MEVTKMRIDRIKLIAEMARQGITSRALAEKAFISRVTISAMRCGKSVNENSARRVAQALGTKVTDLLETDR